MPERRGPLHGITVVERTGRLAVSACGHLLAALGARVIRIATPQDDARALTNRALRRLRDGGKMRLALAPGPQGAAALERWLARADVVLLEPPESGDVLSSVWGAVADEAPQTRVVAFISPAGRNAADLPAHASDVLIQAACGLMAVTGESEARPEYAHVPIADLTGAVVAMNAILAALRVRRRDGAGQIVDLSLVEAMADQLRTHVGLVRAGHTRGFRIGCRHPIACPWNVYRARDGWVMLCAPSDANWRALLEVIGRSELQGDERYAGAVQRRRHVDAVDALLQQWIGAQAMDHVIATLSRIDVPAGPALEPEQVASDPVLIDCGTVQLTPSGPAPRLAFRLSRSALSGLTDAMREEEDQPTPPQSPPPAQTLRQPLAGVRVIELTRYAAGPLTGYLLAALGAEVIKIEPPGGEETRVWMPRFGDVSGYFANFNAGKAFVCLDLKDEDERARLHDMIACADVLLHNMRPGAMERLGLAADQMTARVPSLVYCAISGYGSTGPALAALDTVIQARVGLTALVGDRRKPLRIGYSIADQLAGHYAAAGILSALAERDASGCGQVVDVSMADAIAWLTHPAWSGERTADEVALCRLRAADGWIMAHVEPARASAILGVAPETLTRRELLRRLSASGIDAAAVLEVDEVLDQPELCARGSVYPTSVPGGSAPVLVAPFALTRTPVRRGERVGAAGEDNARIIQAIRAAVCPRPFP